MDYRTVILENHWDHHTVLRNPHKGWYHHYLDNTLHKYGVALDPNDYLVDFPGLNHIYLRIAWSHLEPREGEYHWEVIDSISDEWRRHGYTVAYRISCKETSSDQRFATPEWVMNAGARGTFYPENADESNWEPDYGDPVFLEKLENFHHAFAARYDGKPWVEYIDIGSYGEWGEGHTERSSRRDWPEEIIMTHIDIHTRCYPHSVLVLNDDVVGSRRARDGSRERILDYAVASGLAIRDDGIGVASYSERFGKSTLRDPDMFDRFWRSRPVDIEAEHYAKSVESGAFQGGEPLAAACQESHATYVGFHGDARRWLRENPERAASLANRVGYWLFPKSLELPAVVEPGDEFTVKVVWENHGYAPPYRAYRPIVSLVSSDGSRTYRAHCPTADARTWTPGPIVGNRHRFQLPAETPEGEYAVVLSLEDDSIGETRCLSLGLDQSLRTDQGGYQVAKLQVSAPERR